MAQPTRTARAYCFTLNNPDPIHLINPELFIDGPSDLIRYAIWQLETGDSGTQHFQGYLELRVSCRYTKVISSTNLKGAHFEPRRGNRDQARDYCRKEESRVSGPWEFGSWETSQGKRSDLADVVEAINRGDSVAEIAAANPTQFIKYHRGIEKLHAVVHPWPERTGDDPVSTILFLGPPGCGKTRRIRQLAGPDTFWKDNGNWWWNYRGQRVVVFDDMSGSSVCYRDFKRICDRYPYTIEFKGGCMPLAATTFYLSSCSMPDRWWNPEKVREYNFQEIARRITTVNVYDPQTKTFLEFHSTEDHLSFDQFLQHPLSKYY